MTLAVLPESIRVKTKGPFVIRDPKGPSQVQLASTLTLNELPFRRLDFDKRCTPQCPG